MDSARAEDSAWTRIASAVWWLAILWLASWWAFPRVHHLWVAPRYDTMGGVYHFLGGGWSVVWDVLARLVVTSSILAVLAALGRLPQHWVVRGLLVVAWPSVLWWNVATWEHSPGSPAELLALGLVLPSSVLLVSFLATRAERELRPTTDRWLASPRCRGVLALVVADGILLPLAFARWVPGLGWLALPALEAILALAAHALARSGRRYVAVLRERRT